MTLADNKMKKRDAFVFPFKWIEMLKEASADEFRQVITAAEVYAETSRLPDFEDRYLRCIWDEVRSRIDRDEGKYDGTCERNKQNGKKGGRPCKNPEKPQKPSGIMGNPEEPKKPNGIMENPEEPKKPEIGKGIGIDIKENTKETPEAFSLTSLPPPALSFKQWTEQQFIDEVRKYPEYADLADDFINYWTETNGKGKMLFQTKKSWETKKRLARWQTNNYSGNHSRKHASAQPEVETMNTFKAF